MAEKKKILYLITKSNFGGAQKYVYDLATNLPADKFDITVAGGGTGEKGAGAGKLKEKLDEKNIIFREIKSFTRDIYLLNEPSAFFEVGKIIWQEKPDTIHVNSSKAAGVGGFVARLLFVPKIIYTVHGWPFNDKVNILSKILRYFFSWLTCVLVHRVIVINPIDFKQGQKMFLVGRKMNLVYNGIPPIDFLEKQEAREKLGDILSISFSDEEKIVGTIAELHPNKNLASLIRAVSDIENLKLVIVGSGEEKEKLQKLINKLDLQNRVFLVGFLAEAGRYLKAFDLFALVSYKEGLPYAILEAGLAGLPVIGSDLPGIKAILEKENGILVKPLEGNIAQATKKIIADKDYASLLGKNLKNKIEEDFNLEKMLTKTARLY